MKEKVLGVAAAVSAALVVAACSSSGSSTQSAASTTSPASTASAASTAQSGTPVSTSASGLASAEAVVKAATSFPTAIPVTTPLPSKPPTGKTVLFLQCELSSCVAEGTGIKAATAAIGWTTKVLNFQAANPATLVAALKTGLQYHPVAAFFSGVPQVVWNSVAAQYAHAGAFITENFDASAPSGPGVQAGYGYQPSNIYLGKLLADQQIVAAQGAPVKSLLISVPAYPVFTNVVSSYKATIAAQCPACSVSTINISLPQIVGGQLDSVVVSAAKRISGLKYIVSTDSQFIAQLPQALQAAGIAGQYTLIGGEGGAIDQQNVKNGLQLATVNLPATLGGWEDVDHAIRMVMGLPVPAGDHTVQLVLLTKSDIGTPQDSYDVPSDYAAQFMKLWHVG